MIHIFFDWVRGQVDGWISAKLVSFVIALLCIWAQTIINPGQ